jgi:hypothetical protein
MKKVNALKFILTRLKGNFTPLSWAFAVSVLMMTSQTPATATKRIRLSVGDAPKYMSQIRFGKDSIAQMRTGRLKDKVFYPGYSYNASFIGATTCASLLDRMQEFPLRGMLQMNYIDQETFDLLEHSENYIDPSQVTFVNVYALLNPNQYLENYEKILPSQIALGPHMNHPTQTPVSLGTLFLVNGFEYTPEGIIRKPLPWTKDPIFTEQAGPIISDTGFHGGLDFELGRGFQVAPEIFHDALQSLIITMVHHIAHLRVDFDQVRVFVHSYKEANTKLYMLMNPEFKVVAIDPNNPENVILSTTLGSYFKKGTPWNLSAPLRQIVDAMDHTIRVDKAWALLNQMKMLSRLDLDYTSPSGTVSAGPILVRNHSNNLSQLLMHIMHRWNVTNPQVVDEISKAINHTSRITEPAIEGPGVLDPVAKDVKLMAEIMQTQKTLTISNLDATQLATDPDYPLRVLFGSAVSLQSAMQTPATPNAMRFMAESKYAFVISDRTLAQAFQKLNPSEHTIKSWMKPWTLISVNNESQLKLTSGEADVFIFTFSDIDRLAKTHPSIFNDAMSKKNMKIGYWMTRGQLETPTGL